jgi:hypothetical protein
MFYVMGSHFPNNPVESFTISKHDSFGGADRFMCSDGSAEHPYVWIVQTDLQGKIIRTYPKHKWVGEYLVPADAA